MIRTVLALVATLAFCGVLMTMSGCDSSTSNASDYPDVPTEGPKPQNQKPIKTPGAKINPTGKGGGT